MRKLIQLGVGVAVVATTALTGCSSSSKSTSNSTKTSTTDAKPVAGLTNVDVGYVPFNDDAVLFLAKDSGVFAKHGLNVTLHAAASPTPIVASMASGQYQFGFITAPVLINSNIAGQKLQCVSVVDGQVDPGSDSAAFVASAKSGITSAGQMSGKTIAVVQLSSLNLIEAKKITGDAGATNVKYVSIPFPQMPQALKDGRVDGAVITSPYLQTALKEGAKQLATPNSQLFPNGTVYCFGSTAKYLGGNAKTAQAFQDAMNETTTYAKTHLSEEKATLAKYLKLTPAEAAAQEIASNYVPVLNVQTLSDIQDLMKSQGSITTTIDPKTLVWNPSS